MIYSFFISVVLLFSDSSASAGGPCFSAEKNETVKKFLAANNILSLLPSPRDGENTISRSQPDLNEDAKVIAAVHEKIRSTALKLDVDPRLIYGILIGSSLANPFQKDIESPETRKVEVYGLFGFRQSAAQEVHKACDTAKQPRICQLNYYLDHYLPSIVDLFPEACLKKEWKNLSAAEKLNYLALDACSGLEQIKRLCLSDRKYQNSGACALISDVVDWSSPDVKKPAKIPLCEVSNAPEAKPGPDSKSQKVEP